MVDSEQRETWGRILLKLDMTRRIVVLDVLHQKDQEMMRIRNQRVWDSAPKLEVGLELTMSWVIMASMWCKRLIWGLSSSICVQQKTYNRRGERKCAKNDTYNINPFIELIRASHVYRAFLMFIPSEWALSRTHGMPDIIVESLSILVELLVVGGFCFGKQLGRIWCVSFRTC